MTRRTFWPIFSNGSLFFPMNISWYVATTVLYLPLCLETEVTSPLNHSVPVPCSLLAVGTGLLQALGLAREVLILSHRAPAVRGVDAAPMGEQGQIMPWYPLQKDLSVLSAVSSEFQVAAQGATKSFTVWSRRAILANLGAMCQKGSSASSLQIKLDQFRTDMHLHAEKNTIHHFKAKFKIVENKAPRSSPRYGLSKDFEGQTDTKIHLKKSMPSKAHCYRSACWRYLPGTSHTWRRGCWIPEENHIGKPWCHADLLLSAEARVPYVRHAIGYPCSKFSRVCPNIGDTPWTP